MGTTMEMMMPGDWFEATESIAQSALPPAIAFICGPANSGKSVFSRLLLDALLRRYKSVAYLDTDVGQPEFTPPGCQSLHIIQEQPPDLSILCLKTPEKCFYFGDSNCGRDHKTYLKNIFFSDLSILCLKTPEKCFYFGDSNCCRDPKTYLKNIFSLYDYFLENYYQPRDIVDAEKPMLPLVVNTSGWIKGIGYDMLVEMLRHASATHVVQIRVSAERKNLPLGKFWLDENIHESSPTNLIEIRALQDDSSSKSNKLPTRIRKDASNLREIRVIAYFRQCLPRDLDLSSFEELVDRLASIPPYRMTLSKVKIMHLHHRNSNGESYEDLNAKVVGLGISSSRPASPEHCTPWCVGLGIVRAIDVSKDELYVVAPVSLRVLEMVDTIFQGSIDIPTCLLKGLGHASSSTTAAQKT